MVVFQEKRLKMFIALPNEQQPLSTKIAETDASRALILVLALCVEFLHYHNSGRWTTEQMDRC